MNKVERDLQSELRETTLANNLVWLASFGCEIVRSADIIEVTHADIPEYNAQMIVGWTTDTSARLESLLNSSDHKTNFYVDEPFVNDAGALLLSHGLQPAFSSRVKFSQLKSKAKAPAGYSLRRAETTELEPWCDLYAAGFGRKQLQALDRKRWQRAFASPAISHWFFVAQDQQIGVMQTCSTDDVVGIYSVTFLTEYRGTKRIIAVAKALRAALWEQGARTIYFERVRRRVWQPSASSPMFRQFKTLRKFLVYRKSEL